MSKTARMLRIIRENVEKRYTEKIGYASRAFRPFAKCERNNVTFFVSSVELSKSNGIEMVRTF